MAGQIESLFQRYRTQGDVGALGEVFDRTAGELFRVAVHLSRDPLAAEDLLQQTFLAAIERRDRYDASRPLLPWLLGILSNMARRRWREGTRQPDPDRLSIADASHGHPLRGDIEARVLDAVERLQPPYREVVLLNLRFGLEPADIALLTDREPGTVRTQLQRGLEKLRDRLPASICAGLVPALRGLPVIREVVVAKAGAATAAAAPATVGLGGLLLAVKHPGLAAALLLPLLALGALLAFGWGGDPADESAVAAVPEIGVVGPAVDETVEAIVWNDREGGASPAQRRDVPLPSPAPATAKPTAPSARPTPATPPRVARAPTTPSAPPPATSTPDLGTGTKPRIGPPSFEDWTFWYHHNKQDIEHLKVAIYRLHSSENALFASGNEDDTNVTGATRVMRRQIESVVIPALLWAMESKNSGHQDTESAAYIALAKIARDPTQIGVIQRALDQRLDKGQIVQESAALALGLLRRARSADQFGARDLDDVRAFLFQVFENPTYPPRTRGFAAVALGLLGDQPTGSAALAGNPEASARATTQRLFELLAQPYENQDLYVGLLSAVGMQPATSLTAKQRNILADAAVKGRLYKEPVNHLIRAYAAHSLGRIGTRNDIKTLENILTARRGMSKNVQRSAAIGLGLLGRRVAGEARVDVAKVLLRSCDKLKDNTTKNFAIISLAYLLIDDIKSSTTDVLAKTQADEKILDVAENGSYMFQPFGAIALGLILRNISDELEIDKYQEFKATAQNILREGLASKKMSQKNRAAFATAVGIAKDAGSSETLRQIVANSKGFKELRGYAALGLGLIGNPTPGVMKTIAEAMRERSSEELRRQTAVALGLLGNHKIQGTGKTPVELLVQELKQAKSQNHKGQIVLALASIGNEDALEPLLALLKNKGEQDLTRALACAGLGLIGDLELLPSLGRAVTDMNYRASTDLINELASIL